MREHLLDARMAAGMTMRQMADKLSISPAYYQQIEAGKRNGNIRLWDMLEDITGINQRVLRDEGRMDNDGES